MQSTRSYMAVSAILCLFNNCANFFIITLTFLVAGTCLNHSNYIIFV